MFYIIVKSRFLSAKSQTCCLSCLTQHAVRVVPRPAQHTTRVECNAQKQHAPCVASNTQVCQNNFRPRGLGRDEHATRVLKLADG